MLNSQEYIQLNSKISALQANINTLNQKMIKMESVTEADRRETQLRDDMTALENDLSDVLSKVAKVNLPNETRFYLSEQEVELLKTSLAEFKVIKAEVNQVLKSVIAKTKYMSS